ncbi:hypothetical protein HYV86_04980 [Candidatus Woesearchaeota archaeon]|nr:hypothetical protein [Candidatus Woesearchaeota archaeon]
MKIYVSHSRSFNFLEEWYLPLRKTLAEKHELILPHQEGKRELNSKQTIKTSDLILAEVTYPSTGMGIELGWADYCNIPIIVFYKKGKNPSPSIFELNKIKIREYNSQEELQKELQEEVEKIKQSKKEL